MKNRHIKEFHEKYDTSISYYKECIDIREQSRERRNKDLTDEDVMNAFPYVGYLRIPVTSENDLWDDSNDDMIVGKVLEVNEEKKTVVVATIDNHNSGIAILKRDYSRYLVEGNCLIMREQLS